MKKSVLLLVALALLAGSADALMYSWTDEKGVINFTEDLGKVPAKYRKSVRKLDEEPPPPTQVIEGNEPKKGESAEPKEKGAAGTPEQGEKKEKKSYGGKDEAAWKNEFGKLKADLQAAEEQLADTRVRLTDTSKMPRQEYLSLQNTVKNLENRVEQLKKRLADLNQTADRAKVPAELR